MSNFFKSIIASITSLIILLSVSSITVPKTVEAQDYSFKGVFANTLYGLLTGVVLGATLTIADGDSHSEDWAQNVGIGGTIGAFIGTTYGIAQHTRRLKNYEGMQSNLRVFIPTVHKPNSSNDSGKSLELHINFVEFRF